MWQLCNFLAYFRKMSTFPCTYLVNACAHMHGCLYVGEWRVGHCIQLANIVWIKLILEGVTVQCYRQIFIFCNDAIEEASKEIKKGGVYEKIIDCSHLKFFFTNS